MAIIAEGIPERITQQLNKKAKDKGVVIIGPATVSSNDVELTNHILNFNYPITFLVTVIIFLLGPFKKYVRSEGGRGTSKGVRKCT